jgi:hypothetical protein
VQIARLRVSNPKFECRGLGFPTLPKQRDPEKQGNVGVYLCEDAEDKKKEKFIKTINNF